VRLGEPALYPHPPAAPCPRLRGFGGRRQGQRREDVTKGLNWTIALGIVLVLMGLAAIISPFVAAVFVTIILGWMFVVGAILRGIDALRSRYERSFVWQLLMSILYGVLGMLILTNLFRGLQGGVIPHPLDRDFYPDSGNF